MRLMLSEQPKVARNAKCFVDGVDVSRRCYGADEEKGEAYCYVEQDGHFQTEHSPDCGHDPYTGGCQLKREVLRGRVKLEIPNA